MEHDMEHVIAAARLSDKAHKIAEVGSVLHYLMPTASGPQHLIINTETGLPQPVRKRGMIQVFDAVSFNAILAANAEYAARIYINRDANAPAIVAVLNGNDEQGPGWGDFRAEILFRFTSQWLKWKAIDGKMMPQVQFAEFIEDNLGDIAAPAGAELLEIAQYLSATRSVDFKSAVRLSSGQIQFQNIESIDAKVGAGQTAVPETITLGIAPVFGLPPFKIDVRFRYRIVDGKLQLGVKLQRVEDIMAAVVNDMVNGTMASDGRPAVMGISAPQGSVMVEGLAPAVTK